MKKYLEKWYVWVCLLFALLFTYGFITAQVYAWHPAEFHLYANEEMVATAQELFKQMEIEGFNECIVSCNEYFEPEETNYVDTPIMKCFDSCNQYYGVDLND